MQSQLISDDDVLFEDNHLIAINKKAGILVQGDKTGDPSLADSLADYLRIKYNKPGNIFTGVIHRIDRPVSGLVMLAKTSKALARMNELFKTREVKKIYLCLVEGKVNDLNGSIVSYLKKDEKKNKSFSRSKESEGYKKAELNYEVLQHLDRYSLLKIEPLTGRHHQIRAQLASIGHIIKGDLKYGAKRSNSDGSISLHSSELSFIHPVKNTPVYIKAPLPKGGSWDVIDQL